LEMQTGTEVAKCGAGVDAPANPAPNVIAIAIVPNRSVFMRWSSSIGRSGWVDRMPQ
jgi:hypothetical protein